MKEFMRTNTVTHNLMSFSAFKAVLLFTLLLDGPKTYKELRKAFKENEYLHEEISTDALRIYINSLKETGCDVQKTTVGRTSIYQIEKGPLKLEIPDEQAKSILKVYKTISKSISLSDYISLQKFFEKFSEFVINDDLKEKFQNISPLNNINADLVKELNRHIQNHDEIIISYYSKVSGRKNITILPDKLEVNNRKLYLYGFNSEHQNYGSFLVSKIESVVGINIDKKELKIPEIKVIYELDNRNKTIDIRQDETVLKNDKGIMTIEICSKNKFDVVQRILSHTDKCKVISPDNFKQEIINCLKGMKEDYLDKE